MAVDTRDRIVRATREVLQEEGHANLSTRRVAERAGVPLSQIHYHFGGRQGLLLALLSQADERLLERQTRMYAADKPLWRRYDQACDFLEEDLASGYVRMLQEMIAAGWTDPAIAEEVSKLLKGWLQLLDQVVTEASSELGDLGTFKPGDIAKLVGLSFLGGESLLLLGGGWSADVLTALRSITKVLRARAR
jgi:AcrR family transcriptional regulator